MRRLGSSRPLFAFRLSLSQLGKLAIFGLAAFGGGGA